MTRLAYVGLVAVTIMVVGCGGTSAEPAAESDRQDTLDETEARTGVPACWRDVAETYRDTSTKAFPVLAEHVPDMIERYDALVAADAGSDEGAFKRAYDRLLNTIGRAAGEAEAFLKANADAQEAHAACTEAPSDESVDVCWNKVALAHEAAAEQARLTLRRHLQGIFDAFDMIFHAAARKDETAVAAGNRRLAAAFEAITPGARTYARQQGTAERVYTDCAGVA